MSKKKTVYEAITEAQTQREAMLADLRAKLAEAEAAKAEADAKAREAINTGNADAYAQAKSDSRTAADKTDFYNIQIKTTESAPLFEDYAEKIAEIKADQQQRIEQINERAVKAMHEVYDMISEFYSELDETNKYLKLAHDNTGFTFTATTALPVGTIYGAARAVTVNGALAKYW